jgi:uncharacterized protein YeeX (DUF496 family)
MEAPRKKREITDREREAKEERRQVSLLRNFTPQWKLLFLD